MLIKAVQTMGNINNFANVDISSSNLDTCPTGQFNLSQKRTVDGNADLKKHMPRYYMYFLRNKFNWATSNIFRDIKRGCTPMCYFL